jgi:ribonuclease R
VLSHNVPCGNLSNRNEVQKLLAKLGTIPIGQALKIGFLRSLMRARYAVEPLGHYGLAKKKYAHFTSPIRRYADLVVHRALFQSSHGSVHSLKQTADHISDTERNSADAERDSKDVKLFAFLKAQLQSGQPQRYAALVTDVRNMGFFVDVPELGMSGLVPLSTMEDDFYVFEPARNHLIGRRTRRIIRLGDKLEVQVANVNSFKKQVDFRLAKTIGARPTIASRPRMDQRRADDRRPMSTQRPRMEQRRGDDRRPTSTQRPRMEQRRPDDRRPMSAPRPPMERRRADDRRPISAPRPPMEQRRTDNRRPMSAQRPPMEQRGTDDRRPMSTPQGRSPLRRSFGQRETIRTSRPRPSGGRPQGRRR